VFSAVERRIRPSELKVGRVNGAPAPGEVTVAPVAAEIGPQGVAAINAAANGYTASLNGSAASVEPAPAPR
jgi:hypothetical protein